MPKTYTPKSPHGKAAVQSQLDLVNEIKTYNSFKSKLGLGDVVREEIRMITKVVESDSALLNKLNQQVIEYGKAFHSYCKNVEGLWVPDIQEFTDPCDTCLNKESQCCPKTAPPANVALS